MVRASDQARLENPGERSVMLTDASNIELDRINALAQERRADAGELGGVQSSCPTVPTASRRATRSLSPRRSTNRATRGSRTARSDRDESPGRGSSFDRDEGGSEARGTTEHGVVQRAALGLRAASLQTVECSFVLTGGWQTDRERAYVALTRARSGPTSRLARGSRQAGDGYICDRKAQPRAGGKRRSEHERLVRRAGQDRRAGVEERGGARPPGVRPAS